MVTVTKAPKDARFFSNMSNARRALKKVFNCTTEVANMLIKQEMLEEGGRFWFSEAEVNRAANPAIAADKIATVAVPAPAAPAAATVSAPQKFKSRSEIRNGVRKPIKGKCAEIWATLDDLPANELPTIKHVRDLAQANNWNLNNATIEFYGWRKFHGLNNKKAK